MATRPILRTGGKSKHTIGSQCTRYIHFMTALGMVEAVSVSRIKRSSNLTWKSVRRQDLIGGSAESRLSTSSLAAESLFTIVNVPIYWYLDPCLPRRRKDIARVYCVIQNLYNSKESLHESL